ERIAIALRELGHEPLEVYPFATLRLLGLPWQAKKTPAGRRRIHRALKPMVPGLEHPRASEHQLDSVVCALTALLWPQGRTRSVGLPEEGLMIIPDVGACDPARDEGAGRESRDIGDREWPAGEGRSPPRSQCAGSRSGEETCPRRCKGRFLLFFRGCRLRL